MAVSTRTGLLVICAVLGFAVQLEATPLSARVQQDQQEWARQDIQQTMQQDMDRQGYPQNGRQPSIPSISQDRWQPRPDYLPRPHHYLHPKQPSGANPEAISAPHHQETTGQIPEDTSKPPPVPTEYFRKISEIPITSVEDKIIDQIEGILMVVNAAENRATLSRMIPLAGQPTLLKTTVHGVTFIIGMYGMYRVGVVMSCQGNEGPSTAGMKLIKALDVVKPKFVISVGVCFGKDKSKQKLGDIIVASMIRIDTHKRVGQEEVVFRSSHPPVNSQLLDLFQQTAGFSLQRADDDFVKIKIAPMISVPNLIDDPKEKERLFSDWPDAKGGEMEGAGIISVAIDEGYKAILIKAIVDWADGTKNKEWQPFGAYAATSYVYYQLNGDKSKSLTNNK